MPNLSDFTGRGYDFFELINIKKLYSDLYRELEAVKHTIFGKVERNGVKPYSINGTRKLLFTTLIFRMVVLGGLWYFVITFNLIQM